MLNNYNYYDNIILSRPYREYKLTKQAPYKYAEVSDNLSRSAQPSTLEFEWLKENGITDVINLRKPKIEFASFDEQAVVENLGMKYHNIPAYTSSPKAKQVNKFLQILEEVEKRNGKALLHCAEGVDRTGIYTLIYKSVKDIGIFGDNLRELITMGFHFKMYRDLIPWAVKYANNYREKHNLPLLIEKSLLK